MPTRDPANIVQSWMRYTETRAIKILSGTQQDHDKGRKREKNDLAMLFRLTSLKQVCLSLSLGKMNQQGK